MVSRLPPNQLMRFYVLDICLIIKILSTPKLLSHGKNWVSFQIFIFPRQIRGHAKSWLASNLWLIRRRSSYTPILALPLGNQGFVELFKDLSSDTFTVWFTSWSMVKGWSWGEMHTLLRKKSCILSLSFLLFLWLTSLVIRTVLWKFFLIFGPDQVFLGIWSSSQSHSRSLVQLLSCSQL